MSTRELDLVLHGATGFVGALPQPGDGPSTEQRATGRFRLQIRTTTTSGARYLARVGADHDPGYDETAVMLVEAALSLTLDVDGLPERSGVLAPATALGLVLVERLRARGFVFDTSRDTERGDAGAVAPGVSPRSVLGY